MKRSSRWNLPGFKYSRRGPEHNGNTCMNTNIWTCWMVDGRTSLRCVDKTEVPPWQQLYPKGQRSHCREQHVRVHPIIPVRFLFIQHTLLLTDTHTNFRFLLKSCFFFLFLFFLKGGKGCFCYLSPQLHQSFWTLQTPWFSSHAFSFLLLFYNPGSWSSPATVRMLIHARWCFRLLCSLPWSSTLSSQSRQTLLPH